MNQSQLTHIIKEEVLRLGFGTCGVSKATFLKEEASHLEKWLKNGMNGKMKYMDNYFDKRLDPRLMLDGAKSVISMSLNYYPSEFQNTDAPKISKYAYGQDYHFVIKNKLTLLLNFIKEKAGDVNALACVDSAPVLDKTWAKKSGLGWMGKNTNLINKKDGSFFFLAELILDLELDFDLPVEDMCGTCTRCIDACPTDAILQPYVVDGSRCISYFTIELKENMPSEFAGKMDGWVFGCDICQDVCPWNRFSKPHQELGFNPKREILEWNKKDWQEATQETFKKVFSDSPLKRTGFKGIKRNLDALF